MYGWSGGLGWVQCGAVALPDGSVCPESKAPAGYWTNPANTSQYLPQGQAAKIGSFCMQGPIAGRWAVGGNYDNSVLFCKNLPCQDSLIIYGGLGLALLALAPGPWKLLGVASMGVAAIGCI